jgi:uncharacterized protein (DUF2147 family)
MMRIKNVLLIAVMSIFVSAPVFSQSAAGQLMGKYYIIKEDTKSESRVQIYKNAAGKYEGKIVWLKNPNHPDGTPKYDTKNPNLELRKVKSDQIVLLKDFTYDEKNKEWSGGTIYDPEEGKTYKCKMNFESPNKLKVRGYIGIPTFGKTMYWTKENN